jgi:fructose-bisphosphate aldolase, class II
MKYSNPIDRLAHQSVFGSNSLKQKTRKEIDKLSKNKRINCASIHDFYMAKANQKVSKNITVPAINIRGMSYDVARAAFASAKKLNVGAIIFEIARSEIGYTNQSPQEYVTVIKVAALRENWSGPLFIQGDHFQAKAEKPGIPQKGEIQAIKKLIKKSVDAGFYNIDIDMSTLVNLEKETEDLQQAPNIKYSLEITNYIRSIEPKGVTVSLGGEIGHIGGKNSTTADFEAFMNGYNQGLDKNKAGLSKISVQTGTHHGGVVLADGSLADVNIDFSILLNISKIARKKYKIAGTVQHGASTLPDNFFEQFPQSESVEVHLATGFQNIQMDHKALPASLLKKMYKWLDENKSNEKTSGQTAEQFHYKLRKKAWGQFKREAWEIPEKNKAQIRSCLQKRFSFLFKELNVVNTKNLIENFVSF